MTVPTTDQPVHKSAQRLRWFVDAFDKQVRATEAQTGHRFDTDRAALAAVFADWLRAFEAQKPTADGDKPAYVGFASGLMLRALITHAPVEVTHHAGPNDDNDPASFWPEGFLYVTFCLNVRGQVLEADYHAQQHPGTALGDPRTWWSFRENVKKDSSQAIAFMDLFAGDKPEWQMPQRFRLHRDDGPDLIG